VSYVIQILPRAERQLAALEKNAYEIIKSKIASLPIIHAHPGAVNSKTVLAGASAPVTIAFCMISMMA
jgi:mRNA-degrading endonuclease RelE of RelBE toxin-antitoxin system